MMMVFDDFSFYYHMLFRMMVKKLDFIVSIAEYASSIAIENANIHIFTDRKWPNENKMVKILNGLHIG